MGGDHFDLREALDDPRYPADVVTHAGGVVVREEADRPGALFAQRDALALPDQVTDEGEAPLIR